MGTTLTADHFYIIYVLVNVALYCYCCYKTFTTNNFRWMLPATIAASSWFVVAVVAGR